MGSRIGFLLLSQHRPLILQPGLSSRPSACVGENVWRQSGCLEGPAEISTQAVG